ncbi:transmembrane protein, putative (macronuclear) [Tetrahymena thermophila SB210]|uniref:Transmembrane protein, putative n=1 Tax=Tetrahymena thermophila (strain SB210) TaxID=312017 RepID=I7ME44_TETTS|nr:transmembrane protein, putative [Tetrahymena thermophila SB210]EAR94218.2 transmembrane protein, putative [Tetrahymena thermophila SB210]|eukprot:XP_001014463.2 transmembrane protein, putative [Tetrahymena thermophila SB210]
MQFVQIFLFLAFLVKCSKTFQLNSRQQAQIVPESCDQNISEQLTNQNIPFDCIDGILKVKSSVQQVNFQLILSNYTGYNSYIVFQDIALLNLDIQLTQFSLMQLQKQPLIMIQNVIEVKISNLTIEQQIYLEQSQATQMILCENINSLIINNMILKNNSFNYLLQEQNSEIQFQSQQIQLDSLLIDSYDGAVQIISEQQLIIQEIISINSLQKDQNFTFLVECNDCLIGSILVYKENQFVIDVISTSFNFQVQQQLIIQNITLVTDQNCHLCNYQWQFNNQTSQGTQIQSQQFIQINYIYVTQTFQSQKLESLGSIFIYASDINSFTIKNALFENITSSNLAISFNNIHQAQFTNIQALNNTHIVDFFTIIRSSQVNFQNFFIDFITANSTNQLITLSTFTQAYFDSLMLPINPHLGEEIQKFRSGNPLITVVDGQLVQFNNSQINLKNVDSAFIIFIDINQFISINTTFQNIYSYKNSNGGCLNFGNTNSITLNLTDTIFDNCISSQFGGAIFGGILIKAKNVLVTNCRSEVGGGFFLSNKSDLLELKNIVFILNEATFYSDDYLLGFKSITIDSIYEYNQNLGGTDFYFMQINQQSNNTYMMYSGLIYAIYFKIQMNDKDQKQLDIPVNLYMFCQLDSNLQQNFQQFQIPIMNNLPYMVLYQNPANFLTDQKIVLKFADSFTIDQTFTIPNGFCTEGMELIQLVSNQYMCKYCDQQKANYDFTFILDTDQKQSQQHEIHALNMKNEKNINSKNVLNTDARNQINKIDYPQYNSNYPYQNQNQQLIPFQKLQISQCQTCNPNFFESCYANYSSLKSGFWRNNYTVNQTFIYLCQIQQENCQGGSQTGNYLCSEGYIGPQCLICDRKGVFWNQSFGQSGTFQCNLCGNKKDNTIKIILTFITFYFIIVILIYSNFKSLKNMLFANYLSKMNIIYIGNSVQMQGETSVLIKTLMFNFSIYQVSNFISQKNLLDYLSFFSSNPIDAQFISIDCFLNDFLPSDYNIGVTKLALCILIPTIVLASIVIVLLILKLFKILPLKTIFSISLMAYIYLFVFSFFTTTLEYSLEAFKCIQLEFDQSYLMIDLSLNCNKNSNSDIDKIKAIGLIIFILFCIISPFLIFLICFMERKRLNKVQVFLKYGFLFREYKKKFYLWEVARLMLKISIVSIKVIFINSSVILVTLYSICLVIYLGVFFQFQPFMSKKFNRLEILTIIVAIINILSSSLLRQSKLQNNGEYDTQQSFSQILYYFSQTIQFIYFSILIVLIVISFFSNKIKRLQKYRAFSCLSYYFPIYPYRLFQNYKKLREKVISKSYKIALQSEFLPLKSNVQMQDLSLEKYVQSEILIFKSE